MPISSIDIVKLQSKVANSFLRGFYPAEYRANNAEIKKLNLAFEAENKNLRTTATLTGRVGNKMTNVVRTITSQYSNMMDAVERLQATADSDVGTNADVLMNALAASSMGLAAASRGGSPFQSGADTALEDDRINDSLNDIKEAAENSSNQQGAQGSGGVDVVGDTILLKGLSPGGKLLGFVSNGGLKVAGIVMAAQACFEAWSQISALDPNMPKSEYREAVAKIIGRLVGDIGLAWAGAFIAGSIAGAITGGVGIVAGFLIGLAGGTILQYVAGDSVHAITDYLIEQMWTGTEDDASSSDGTITPKPDTPTEDVSPPEAAPPASVSENSSGFSFISSANAGELQPGDTPALPAPPLNLVQPPPHQELAPDIEPPDHIEPPDLTPYTVPEPPKYQPEANIPAPAGVNGDEETNTGSGNGGGNNNGSGGGNTGTNSGQKHNSDSSESGGQYTAGQGEAKVIYRLGGRRPGMPNQRIVRLVSKAAAAVGMTSITITSGKGNYISDAGKRNGQKSTMHSTGDAVDVVGFSGEEQKIAFARAAIGLGAGGIGAYKDHVIHVDLGRRRHWNWGDPNFPAMAEGGKIHPQKGGTLVHVAEAGEPEFIVPQSKVTKFAHEMLAGRPTATSKQKTHVMIVPIYT